MTTGNESPAGKNRRTIPSARRTHGGCEGSRNPRSRKLGASIVLDPHVAGCAAIVLEQDQALAIRDMLAEGLR